VKTTALILFILLCLAKDLQAQTHHTIDSLQKIEQACMDVGYGQMKCIRVFRNQMDSIMQLAYHKLYGRANTALRAALQKEQNDWLGKQRANDNKIETEDRQIYVKQEWSEAPIRMFLFGSKTDFVRDRAKYLVKRLNSH
jgi:uncharacterized protein YecT (DUF1311 family)